MSWFSRLNPTPQFPQYTGPYSVGSIDFEVPISDLTSPSPAPTTEITTVCFRVFYPCDPSTSHENVTWLPSPQRKFISAFGRFLGASNTLSNTLALLIQPLSNVIIPANKDAPVLPAQTKTKRWPLMIFSHGLGGCRNTYSHVVASVASHGVIVVATCHRDGSAPTTTMRSPDSSSTTSIDYISIPHKPLPEVWDARDHQLSIRLWELGLIHDAISKLDAGSELRNLLVDPHPKSKQRYESARSSFQNQFDMHRPGAITWAGHSFGAATMIQFLKSIYWRSEGRGQQPRSILYSPSEDSRIVKQITESSSTVILDLWAMPLQCPHTEWLKEKPLPTYAPNGPGGSTILAVLSDAFVKWEGNFLITKRALSDHSTNSSSPSRPPPSIFYATTSAHLSQSDFGILFPWLFSRTLKVEEPEWILKLNTRAILQLLRNNGVETADTSDTDMGDDGPTEKVSTQASGAPKQDSRILDVSGNVKSWIPISVN